MTESEFQAAVLERLDRIEERLDLVSDEHASIREALALAADERE